MKNLKCRLVILLKIFDMENYSYKVTLNENALNHSMKYNVYLSYFGYQAEHKPKNLLQKLSELNYDIE